MRVWLDPDKLQSRNLTAGDVIRVLREQNVQVAAGQIGQPPAPQGQDFQYTMSTLGRLVESEEFANIIVNTGADGEVTYLKDVSRTELGARSQDTLTRRDGKPAAFIGIFQLPGSNALATADGVKARMRELEARFPKGLKYASVYDTTPFIRESVDEVFHTLRDAVILVAFVVLLFLQDWKSLLLPVIDVAVSLIGTFAVMSLMGFSLNNLTLFGLVLAIGIVVDDAIVVLENIERWLDKGLSVREATIKAMNEITGPILAITLVLSSVLLPSAFLGGLTGQFFRQFALTISVSMIISAINAMTMTPARAAWIFASRKPGEHGRPGQRSTALVELRAVGRAGERVAICADAWRMAGHAGRLMATVHAAPGGLRTTLLSWGYKFLLFLPGAVAGGAIGWFIIRPVNWLLGLFFQGFNWIFERATQAYGKTVGWSLRLSAIVLLVYVGLIGLTGFGFARVPGGFVPSQDKGYLLVNIQLPDSASLERTLEVTEQGRTDCARDAGRRPHGEHSRTVVRAERGQLELRIDVRQPKPIPRSPRRGIERRGDHCPASRALSARDSRGPGARLRAAGGKWSGQRGRVQVDGGSDRRRRLSTRSRRRQITWPPRAINKTAWWVCSTGFAPARRSSMWTSTAPRSRRWASS